MKKNILFIIPSLVGGGAERAFINLLSLLDYNYYDVTVCCIVKKGVYLDKIPKNVKIFFLFKFDFFYKLLFKLHQKIDFFYPIKVFFNRKLKKHFFEIGICFLDGIATELLHNEKIGLKLTWVHSCYKSYNNYYKYYKNPKYVDRLIRKRYENLNAIVFVSLDAKKEFIEIFGSFPQMPVIYNPILSDDIVKKSDSEIVDKSEFSNNFNFVAVGSLIPVKNYELLIEAAKILSQSIYDFKIFILGTGYLENRLKNKVDSLNLSNFIVFKGFLDNPYSFIKACDAFIMTSISEALPTAMIEAMILGKPVITTNVSGSREVVKYGEFGLMTDLDAKDLASAMKLFIINDFIFKEYIENSIKRGDNFTDKIFIQQFYYLLNN